AGFVVLHMRARGIDGGATVFTAFALAVFASRLVLSRVPDRAGASPTATAAGLLEAIGLLIIALATSLTVALAGAVVVGIGFSMLFPSLALMVVGGVGWVDDVHRERPVVERGDADLEQQQPALGGALAGARVERRQPAVPCHLAGAVGEQIASFERHRGVGVALRVADRDVARGGER